MCQAHPVSFSSSAASLFAAVVISYAIRSFQRFHAIPATRGSFAKLFCSNSQIARTPALLK